MDGALGAAEDLIIKRMQFVTHIICLALALQGVPALTAGSQSAMKSQQIEILIPIEMAVANVIKANAPYSFSILQSTISQMYDTDTSLQVIADLGRCFEDFADRFYRGIDVGELDVYNFDVRCTTENPGDGLATLLNDLRWVMNYLALGCRDYLSVNLYRDLIVLWSQSNLDTYQTWGVPSDTAANIELLVIGMVSMMPDNLYNLFNSTIGSALDSAGMSASDIDLFVTGMEDITNSAVTAWEDSLMNPYDDAEVLADADDIVVQFDNAVAGADEILQALTNYLAGLQQTVCDLTGTAWDELELETERLAE